MPRGPAPRARAHRARARLHHARGLYGARPLRRFIQREVATKIGRALVAGDIPDGSTITLDVEGDQLVVRWTVPGAETWTDEREEVTA